MKALAPLATIVYAGELRAPKTPTAKQPHISLFFLALPREIHAHDEVPVAAVLVESLGAEVEGHEGHVRVVHGLKLDPGVGAVP